MARRQRIESAGFHHIYNRGVERRVVFAEPKDKEKFLEIVCEVSEYYDFIIHGYVIMDNHYHLLLENSRENLSAGMRQINSVYAQYFNKKQKRVGHLWQDRFKSWYVYDEAYLFTLFKYLEYNPIKAKITKKVGEFK
jgi:REP element-mobilizing transposase RayT